MNITNTADNTLTTPIEYQEPETTSVFSTILTIFKVILVLGILFFILYEINKQTNNSIMNFFNQLFKSKSTSTTSTPVPTAAPSSVPINTQPNWLSYVTNKTNSFKQKYYKEPFENSLLEHKQYNVAQPRPDDSTSNIQNKKGLNQYTSYDSAYTGKMY